MDIFMDLVNNVGVNVAVIGCAFYFIRYMFDKDAQERKDIMDKYTASIDQMRESIEKNTDAVDILRYMLDKADGNK